MNKTYEPIAIVGSSCSLPGEAKHLDKFWQNLSRSYDGIVDIPSGRCAQDDIYESSPKVGKSYAKKAGLIDSIDSFDAKFFGITKEEAISMDPQQRLLLQAAWHALEDSAQLTNDTLLKDTGLIVGIATDDYNQLGMHSHDLDNVTAYSTLGSLRSVSVGRVAYHLRLNGPVSQIDTACSSSLMAIHQACQSLRLYESDCMLAGGINLLMSPQTMVSLSQIKALSLSNRCSVFDNSADGYVRGEGYGLVVLKRLSDAKANNDNILAVIKGSLANHDGASNGLTAPNGLAQESLLQKTLKISDINPHEINYIETHGTGTLFGDPIEVNSIISVYGENRGKENPLFIGSVKSCIGHLEAAAGVAGVLKVCSSIKNKQLAPNLHYSKPNPYIKWDKTPIQVIDRLQDWNNESLRTAAISSFGFSGTNVHMIIQEPENEKETSTPKALDDDFYLVPISAKSEASLKALVKEWLDADHLSNETIDTISFSAISTRKHFEHKLLVLAKSYEDLKSKLQSWYEDKQSDLVWSNANFEAINSNTIDKKHIDAINNYFSNKSIDFKKLYTDDKISICKLPLYSFDTKKYWWDNPYDFIKKDTNTLELNKDISYKLHWERYTLKQSLANTQNIHIISDNKEDEVVKRLKDSSKTISNTQEFLNSSIEKDTTYIYMIDMDNDINLLETSIAKVWSVVQYFNQNNTSSKIWVLTRQAQYIYEDNIHNINASSIWGLLRSLRLELGDNWRGMIDLPQNIKENTIKNMFKCFEEKQEDQFILRHEKVYVPKLLAHTIENEKPFSFDKKASYLITGGLGALGIALIDHLISLGIQNIIIASRRGEDALKDDSTIAAKINSYREKGKQIDIYNLDLTQELEVKDFFTTLKDKNINLKGITHLSGVISKQDLSNNPSQKDINNFMAAKVKGAWYLHQYSQGFDLDFFILFSSVTALFGMKGLSFYSASNAYLDALASKRNLEGLKTLSINWGRFDIDGMVDGDDSIALDALGVAKLDTKKAFNKMSQYLSSTNHICIADVNWDQFTSYFKQLASIDIFSNLLPKAKETQSTKSIENKEQFSKYFVDIVCKTLKLEKQEISKTQNLFSIGLNSMLSMYIRQALEHDINLKTEPTLFFKKQTIELLEDYLWEQYNANSENTNNPQDQTNGKTIFLFSGQGTQYAGMGKTLYKNNPYFKQSIDKCIDFLEKEFDLDFKSILFDENSKLLKQTKYAQLALFIIEYSLYKLWERQNITAEYFIGHSVGEYVAACLAGVFSTEDALRLLKTRGQLMQSLEGHGDMMVAFDTLENLPALPNTLAVAANNSPFQSVISGELSHLKEYEQELSKNDIKAHLLNTKQAFHSKLMTPILEEFYAVANKVEYKEPKTPIINNISAKEAPKDIANAAYWVDHIISTVQFALSIKKAYESGCRYFVEVGPGSVLKNLTEQNMMQVDTKCYYFNSMVDEEDSIKYLQEQQEQFRSSKKDIIDPNDDSIKENLLKPIVLNEKKLNEPFPLTSMQHAYWLGRNKEVADGGVAIHMYLELDIKDFSKDRFINAWKTLIKRHDMLHSIVDKNGDQKILKEIPQFSVFEHSLKNSDEKQKEDYLQGVRHELSHQNVSLEKWPQFEFRISYLDEIKSRIHISIDGWCIDGWSYQILFYELHELYNDPQIKLPPINISFRDYVLQLKKIESSAFYQTHLEKWRDRLKLLPKAPQLPKNTNKTNTNEFKRWEYFIQKEQYANLKQFASEKSLTTVSTLLAAYAWVLSRYSKEHNITINIPRFNRLNLHEDVNRVIGEFASFTLLACNRDSDTNFSKYANIIQTQLWEDVENPWVPGVTLLRELAKITKQANIVMPFVFTNMPEERLDGKKLEFLNEWSKSADVPYFLTQTPQVQIDCQYHDRDGGLFVFWDVQIDKFEQNVIDDLFNSYVDLLQNLSVKQNAWEENSLSLQKSSTLIGKEVPISQQGLYEQFSNAAKDHSENIAIYSEDTAITYKQLYTKSQELGAYLQDRLDFSDKPPVVAVIMDKGWQQIIAVMGILASGATFLPLDSKLPKDRIKYALENADAKLVITKDKQLSNIQEKLEDTNIPLVSIEDDSIYKQSDKTLEIKFEELICIIYTSGSTGLPKGVMVRQKSLVNNVNYTNKRFDIDSKDSMICLTPMYHDLVLFDIFGALSCGASIVMPEDKKTKDPQHWLDLIKEHKVSIWNTVPTMMEMLLKFSEANLEKNQEALASLRVSILGGDWVPLTIPSLLEKLNKNTRLVSIGGPTETTVWNIMYEVKEFDNTSRSIPYGSPIDNTTYFILNELLEECPIGVTGELYVSGESLAAGYINDEKRTKEAFITNPRTKERMYKTGDLGRSLPNGLIEFMGRSDNQVQISGYRIELSEIESFARKQNEVEKAQALLIKDEGNPYIALVYSCNDGDISDEQLKAKLKEFLPEQMIPKKLLKIEQFPLTTNGKTDRKALEKMVLNDKPTQARPSQKVVENKIQKTLLQLWQKYLERENIGLYENFFEAGGNSLLATELFIAIRKEFPMIDSVVLLYEHTSIDELSKYIEKHSNQTKEVKTNKRGQQRRKRLLAKN